MLCASGSHSRGRELIKCRMPLCSAISGCTVATSLTPSTRTFPEHAGHPPPVRQAPAIEGRHSPFFPYPHFGQIRAILRLLPQVTSSGDTELAVGCHIAATRGHSCATVPRCLRYRHSKSFTVQPPPARLWMFSDFAIFLQLCCRIYHISARSRRFLPVFIRANSANSRFLAFYIIRDRRTALRGFTGFGFCQ